MEESDSKRVHANMLLQRHATQRTLTHNCLAHTCKCVCAYAFVLLRYVYGAAAALPLFIVDVISIFSAAATDTLAYMCA